MKKTSITLSCLLFTVLIFNLPLTQKAEAQVLTGFISVSTDCYKHMGPGLDPVDVGDSSNCVLGAGACADSSCGEGTVEVQRDIEPQ